MKLDEVPQDKGYLIEGRLTDLNYAVDKDGHYTSRRSMGWQPKNEAMTMAWELIYEKAERARQKILSGILSPLVFYMELNIMDVKILANYTGFSRWNVRRHLKMKNFKRLDPQHLSKYAEALNITPAELVDIEKIKQIRLKHED